MRFFIKVCVLFNKRLIDSGKIVDITLHDYLSAIQSTTEYLGDNEYDDYPSCIPEMAGFGGYHYPHKTIVDCFRRACGMDTNMQLADNLVWQSVINRLRNTDYADDPEVTGFTVCLEQHLGLTTV